MGVHFFHSPKLFQTPAKLDSGPDLGLGVSGGAPSPVAGGSDERR